MLDDSRALAELDARVDRMLEKRRWMLSRARLDEARAASPAGSSSAPRWSRSRSSSSCRWSPRFALSFTDFDIYALADLGNLRFVGLANYADLLQTPLFWQALGNTAYFVLVGVPLSIAASLGAALLLNAPLARLRGLFRTALFLPVVTTLVAVAVVWRYLSTRARPAQPRPGALGIDPVDWLGDPRWAMPAIVAAGGVEELRLQHGDLRGRAAGDPERLYEAARLDGARAGAQFRHVTLPMLAPTLLFVGIMTMIGTSSSSPSPT